MTGGLAGTVCFGMTVPGAAIGSLIGTFGGGVAGGYFASNYAQKATKSDVGYMRLVFATEDFLYYEVILLFAFRLFSSKL